MTSPYYAEGTQYDKRSGEWDDDTDDEWDAWAYETDGNPPDDWDDALDAADMAWKERDDDAYC